MKNLLFIATISLVSLFYTAHVEAKPEVSVAPSQFFGKTVEECEQILGKPTKVEELSGVFRGSRRHYKPSIAGLSEICLEQLPQGTPDGPIDTKISCVRYCFPAGSIKTWQEAFTIIGASMAGAEKTKIPPFIKSKMSAEKVAEQLAVPEGATPSTVKVLFHLDGRMRATWTPSTDASGYGLNGFDSFNFSKDF